MQNLLGKLGLGEQAISMVVWVGLSLILLIIVVTLAVWLVRTLRPTLNMSGSQGRGGRPQRLAITDAFTLDREGRKLVIVRRDNVEHLLLIGGPNDVLIESSIVRGERSTRDRGGRATAEGDAILAAEVALSNELHRPDAGTVAPQAPVAAPTATLMPPPLRPAPPPAKPQQPPASRLDDDFERALVAMQNAQRQQAAALSAPVAPPALQPRPAPPASVQQQPAQPPAPAAPLPPMPSAPPPSAPERAQRPEPVSEMARRLNEVLQKPLSGSLRPPFNKPIPPVPATMNSAPRPTIPMALPLEMEAPPAPKPASLPVASPPPVAASAPLPAPPQTSQTRQSGNDIEMDLLEEEMARLLGRPSQPKPPGTP